MRRIVVFHKRALLALLAVLSAVGLAACGEGNGSTATTTSAASTPATTSAPAASTPTATAPAPATPTNTTTSSSKPAPTPAPAPSSASGGGAASFRAPHADNSIPNFGAEAPNNERARATAALSAFLRARAAGDWSTVCSYLARPTRKQLERLAGASKDCSTVLAGLSKGGEASAETLTAGAVAALRIKGASAFALYHGSHNSKYVMPMVNEGGAWKMSQLAPLAYPLGTSTATP